MNKDTKGFYKALGVDKEAPLDNIKKAFRKKAKEVHPDITGNHSDGFNTIAEAYRVLKNPLLRKQYDETGTHEESNDIDIRAQSIVVALFEEFLVDGSCDYAFEDPIATMKTSLMLQIEERNKSIGDSQSKIKKYESKRCKLVFKGDNPHKNLFESVICKKIEDLRVDILQHQKMIDVLNKSIIFLDDYKYDGIVIVRNQEIINPKWVDQGDGRYTTNIASSCLWSI
jgi:DnaJ-class molecular chaperone